MQTNIVRISAIPDELTISTRRAEAILHQLTANCSPLVADFHYGCTGNGNDLMPYNPVCTACQYGVKETVEHVILRCSGRAISRHKYIERIRAKTVEELCREKPLEVLRFLNNGKLLENNFKR